MKIQPVKVYPPLKGAFIDLTKVPDPVFAQKMVGDGFAIDPFENTLHSPVNGIIKAIHSAKHAITIAAHDGFDIMLHLGIETVSLNGNGFTLKVQVGDQVKTGDVLSILDLDYIATHAFTLISPIIITNMEEQQISIEILPHSVILNPDEPIMLVNINPDTRIADTRMDKADAKDAKHVPETVSALVTIPNRNGIHARPAAILSQIARHYNDHEIMMIKGSQSGSLKNIIALLSLGVRYQDQVQIAVSGPHKEQVLEKLCQEIANFQVNDTESSESTAIPALVTIEHKVVNGKYYGIAASSGMAMGKLIRRSSLEFKFATLASDKKSELKKFTQAIASLIAKLETKTQELATTDTTYKNILTAHLMILADEGLLLATRELIASGYSAAYSWDNAISKACSALTATGNSLVIERQDDLIDVKNQILCILCGVENQESAEFSTDVILLAQEFTPSQLLNLSSKVVGLISIKGGITTHVAILARNHGIPLLVGVDAGIWDKLEQVVTLDTYSGSFINTSPTAEEITVLKQKIARNNQQIALIKAKSHEPAITLDGKKITCLANIGSIEDAKLALENGALGVGLLRTEFIFFNGNTPPSEEIQTDIYTRINQVIGNDKPLIIRTLDVGGDKKIPYLAQTHEENPMLGMRGIRLSLSNLELFKTQLRAILRLKTTNLKIMLPMIAKIEEYQATKQIIKHLSQELGISNSIKLGIMVEVPSVAFMAEIFARETDFMSLGTNDLTQYILATDREHTNLAHELDHLHPSVLAAIAATANGASKHNKELSVCGLMASEKLGIAVLIGLGITTLSMTINTIPKNKEFIRNLDYAKCKALADHCLSLTTSSEVKTYLNSNLKIENRHEI